MGIKETVQQPIVEIIPTTNDMNVEATNELRMQQL